MISPVSVLPLRAQRQEFCLIFSTDSRQFAVCGRCATTAAGVMKAIGLHLTYWQDSCCGIEQDRELRGEAGMPRREVLSAIGGRFI
jgi:hypothetical protein